MGKILKKSFFPNSQAYEQKKSRQFEKFFNFTPKNEAVDPPLYVISLQIFGLSHYLQKILKFFKC